MSHKCTWLNVRNPEFSFMSATLVWTCSALGSWVLFSSRSFLKMSGNRLSRAPACRPPIAPSASHSWTLHDPEKVTAFQISLQPSRYFYLYFYTSGLWSRRHAWLIPGQHIHEFWKTSLDNRLTGVSHMITLEVWGGEEAPLCATLGTASTQHALEKHPCMTDLILWATWCHDSTQRRLSTGSMLEGEINTGFP